MKQGKVRKECSNCGYEEDGENCLSPRGVCMKRENWTPKKKVEAVKKMVEHVRTWNPKKVDWSKPFKKECITCFNGDYCLGCDTTYSKWKPKPKVGDGKIVYYCPAIRKYDGDVCKDKKCKSIYGNMECNSKFRLIPVNQKEER